MHDHVLQEMDVDPHFCPLIKQSGRYSFAAPAESQSKRSCITSPCESVSRSMSSPVLEGVTERFVSRSGNTAFSSSDANVAFRAGVTRTEQSGERVREQLLAVGSSFVGFDKTVEEDARRRRAVAEDRRHGVLESMDAIETALQQEARQRAEADRRTHESIQNSLNEMMIGVQSKVSAKFDTLARTVESVNQRCSTLERGIQQFKGELPSKLEVDTSAISRSLRELTAQFEAHSRQTAQKDQHFSQAIAEAHFVVDLQVERSLNQMERRSEALQELVDELAQEEDVAQRTPFEVDVLEQVAVLKRHVADEGGARENADDAIITAIGEYVDVMGRSLHFPNR